MNVFRHQHFAALFTLTLSAAFLMATISLAADDCPSKVGEELQLIRASVSALSIRKTEKKPTVIVPSEYLKWWEKILRLITRKKITHGRSYWSAKDPEKVYLLTVDELNSLPEGTVLSSGFTTKKFIIGKDAIDNDTRGGFTAYGFLESQIELEFLDDTKFKSVKFSATSCNPQQCLPSGKIRYALPSPKNDTGNAGQFAIIKSKSQTIKGVIVAEHADGIDVFDVFLKKVYRLSPKDGRLSIKIKPTELHWNAVNSWDTEAVSHVIPPDHAVEGVVTVYNSNANEIQTHVGSIVRNDEMIPQGYRHTETRVKFLVTPADGKPFSLDPQKDRFTLVFPESSP